MRNASYDCDSRNQGVPAWSGTNVVMVCWFVAADDSSYHMAVLRVRAVGRWLASCSMPVRPFPQTKIRSRMEDDGQQRLLRPSHRLRQDAQIESRERQGTD